MNHRTFHAHFFRDECGAWCVSVRLPDGTRTAPRLLTPLQIYELMPWLEALGISYAHLVDHEQDIEFWISEALARSEKQRARARALDNWEIALWWMDLVCALLAVFFLFIGMHEAAIVAAIAYFPIAFGRDTCAREAAYYYRPLRPMSSGDKTKD